MSKRPFLIISLIVSCLTLIYLILSHTGIIRKWNLKKHNVDFYVPKFTNLPKADKNKVVVYFTTKNNEDIKPFINSILDQSVKIDELILVIPYKNINKIPTEFNKVLSVHGYSKDYDDAANLICSLLNEPETDTKITLLDPSVIYNENFIEELVLKSNENPNKIIYGNKNKEIKHGILLKPKFFNNKISNYQKGKGCCPWLDECTTVEATYLI